jgi:hypothetical protein
VEETDVHVHHCVAEELRVNDLGHRTIDDDLHCGVACRGGIRVQSFRQRHNGIPRQAIVALPVGGIDGPSPLLITF